jgi:MFS family permease
MAFSNGMVIPVMPLYARSLDASYGLVGLMLAAQGLGTLISDVPAGILVRRWGHKRAMILGAACTVVGGAALFWAGSLAEAVAYRLVSGAGAALWGISRHAYLTELVQLQRRGRSIAMLGGIGRVGVFAGPAVGGALAAYWGLRSPFIAFALMALAALLAAAAWVPSERGAKGSGQQRVRLGRVLAEHWRSLASAGSGQLCAQMIRNARHAVIPLYGADILGLGVQEVSWIISLASALDMLMFYPAGLLMDRLGRKYAYVPSFMLQSVGMAMVPFADGFYGLLGAALVIGLGNGLGSGTMMTLGADLAPERGRSEFLGLWRFIGDAGSSGGPLAVGAIAEAMGLLSAPWAIAVLGLSGAAILGFLVPETLKPAPEGEEPDKRRPG